MNIGFIGCGNMATAIISGIVSSNTLSGNQIYIYDHNDFKMDNLVTKYGVNKCSSETEIANNSEYIVLAVKPNVISKVLNTIDETIKDKNSVIISIAAGKTIEFIRENLSNDNKIVRVMPNINAVVNGSCTAYCTNDLVIDKEKQEIEKIFGSIGSIIELQEKDFAIFSVVAGCSPAFSYMYIDALARAGVKYGLNKKVALKIAAQSVLGSAKMILESDEHPFDLIDKVCSPGGTTIEGVTSLQETGFEHSVHKAVEEAFEKDKKM